ncbi:hypothetical protein sscle_01g010830 [Sclerotinia sclerotiorum 1980 UF-70]|uniref:NB-ARC domain-containing protein n=1 Tax=Sclerotinia sclerotiorum (strain ATCC 18683 / 1980 / Ss-1) TaxID=665079 RepID=A0A1D9PVJ6_SCLS1|nr:hypothetical protein sscle_01g010830 [Sclerotinia sclerotiorum 1980 UF-70]
MDEVEQLQFQLKYSLGALKPRLVEVSGNDNLHSTINSAAAVVSSIQFNKHFYIPQNVSSIFTGRESLLEELKHAFDISSPLERNHTQRRFVIYGLGGSGKTQFYCKFAQDNRENFWAIFWIDASSQESARHTFSDIANIEKVEPNE